MDTLPASLQSFVPKMKSISGLSGGDQAKALVELYGGMLDLSKPALLILEDCHWMDNMSWKVVRELVDKCKNLFLLLTARMPDEFSSSGRSRI